MKSKVLRKVVSLILIILVISTSIPLEVFASTDTAEKINSGTLFEASTLDDLQLNITQLPTITVKGTEKYTVNISDTPPITIGGVSEIHNENIIFDCGFDKKLDAEIKVKFSNCGTLNSKPIDMVLTYSDIYSAPKTGTARYDTKCFWWSAYGTKDKQTNQNEWFEVGFGRYNLDIKFYYSNTNTPIHLDNSYLTLYSEDGNMDDNGNIIHTEASCGNDAATNCYIYDNTNMMQYKSWNLFRKQYKNVYYGTKGGSTGAKDKNAICWQFKDRSSINLDMMIGYGLWSMGYHLNFIPLTASIPNAPIKTVSKAEATEKTELQYSIQQFMPKAYDKNFKLQSFEINDVLEDSVNYISAEIIDNNSNNITASAGVLNYDKAARKISYKFNVDYLSNISYEGQSLTMKINVVTKENTDVREIKNTTSVCINNVVLNSNTVQTNIYYPLTVNYLDEQGSSLADSIISDYFVGDNYSTEPKNIENYVLTQTPDNANGTITNSAVTVDYIYKLQDTSVTVNYIDTNGTKLAESINIEGKINDTYTTESKEFYGYELIDLPSNANGTMINDVITVNYVYRLKDTSVTVNYIDENGNPLTYSETISGKVFDEYETENKSFYGYELISVPDNANGEMTEDVITVNYVHRLKDTSVTVNYIDENGNPLTYSKIINGKVFDKYETENKSFYGYELIAVPDNANGIMNEETVIVNYIYVLKDAAVKVNYLDTNGNLLAESVRIEGKVNDTYLTESKEIYGYELTQMPVNARGEMTEDAITVNYIYRLKNAQVEIHYVDRNGNALTDAEHISGNVFDKYTSEPKNIDGYFLFQTPDNAGGEMTEEKIVVTYVYDKNQLPEAPEPCEIDKNIKSPNTGAEGTNYKTFIFLATVFVIIGAFLILLKRRNDENYRK